MQPLHALHDDISQFTGARYVQPLVVESESAGQLEPQALFLCVT